MANTITNLIPLLYDALDIVSRELVGFIPACGRDSSADQVALNQTINIYIAPSAVTGDIAPGATPADDGDQVFGNTTMTITKSKYSPIRWTGEEELSISKNPQRRQVLVDQYSQSMRALVNLIEVDLANAAYQGASRAYGTPGTAPFGTAADLSDAANVFKLLDDNGAARTGRQLVLGTSAMANLRGKQSVLFKANEAGTDELLRQGILGRLLGADVRDSAAVPTPTKGTGSGYLVNNAGPYPVGTTSITLDTGTGTILAGDVVTFAGDTNKYVVVTALAANVIVIGSPGLRQTLGDNVALTVGNTATQNTYFARPYLQLATRTPAMPEGGDAATDVIVITDPMSGLSFQLAAYPQYRRRKLEIGIAWGVKAVKGDGIAVLLG